MTKKELKEKAKHFWDEYGTLVIAGVGVVTVAGLGILGIKQMNKGSTAVADEFELISKDFEKSLLGEVLDVESRCRKFYWGCDYPDKHTIGELGDFGKLILSAEGATDVNSDTEILGALIYVK